MNDQRLVKADIFKKRLAREQIAEETEWFCKGIAGFRAEDETDNGRVNGRDRQSLAFIINSFRDFACSSFACLSLENCCVL